MRVLGLNGWPVGLFHDAAACLVVDGEVVALGEEERFTRRKHAYGALPHSSAEFCLARAGVTLDDVDVVAFGWDLPFAYRSRGLDWTLGEDEFLEALVPRDRFPRRREPRLALVPHHVAHAASAYHLAGRDSAAILVVDGQGESASATLAHGRDGRIAVLEEIPVAWSLGFFYEAVCEYVGLGLDEPGKLMGLAAHGVLLEGFEPLDVEATSYEVRHIAPDLLTTGPAPEEHDLVVAHWLRELERTLPVARNRKRRGADGARTPERDPYEYRDVAASAQNALERAVLALARRALEASGERTLLLAGGVALNASLNGRLLASGLADDLFVQPVAHDAGVALGAAVHAAVEAGDRVAAMNGSIAWGPAFDAGQIAADLERLGVPFEDLGDELAPRAAAAIAGGEPIAWFQGSAEVGPRALGQRSILASPNSAALRDRINAEIKHREWWRPLAPSLLAERADEFLEPAAELPYMIVATGVREDVRERVEGIVHVDGSARPQTVRSEVNPIYGALIEALEAETGTPVVLNTSFNRKNEPIVLTPEDAVRAASEMPVSNLFIGPFLARTGDSAEPDRGERSRT